MDDFFISNRKTQGRIMWGMAAAWLAILAINIAILAGIGFVAWHFIAKVW